MVKKLDSYVLPISGNLEDAEAAFQNELQFLRTSNFTRRTRRTYAGALRLFADWLQAVEGSMVGVPWPLPIESVSTRQIVRFYHWLGKNRARGTQITYSAAVESFMWYLDMVNQLPDGMRLAALKSKLVELRSEAPAKAQLATETVVDAVEQIVAYYDLLPLPEASAPYNRRITLLRNRALVHTLYSTGAQLQDLIALDRNRVQIGGGNKIIFNLGSSLEYTVNLSELAKSKIGEYLSERTDNNPALLLAHSRNANERRISGTSVHNIIKSAIEALELPVAISARHFRMTSNMRNMNGTEQRQVSREISRMFNQIRAAVRLSDFTLQLNDVINNDILEAQHSFANEAYKSCVVMLGAVAEGIMLGFLTRLDVLNHIQNMAIPPSKISSLGLRNPQLVSLIMTKLSFEDLKNVVVEIVPQIEKLQVAGLQSFRNYVHPAVSLKNLQSGKELSMSRKRAVYHLSSLALIAECVATWR